MVIKCNKGEDIKKIAGEIEKVTDDYRIVVPKGRRPSFRVVGLKEELSKKEIENSILCQNAKLWENQKEVAIEVKVVKKMRNRSAYFAIVQSDLETYNRVMANEHLYINWGKYYVYEHTDLLRCLKCAGFNHKAKDCKNDEVCKQCWRLTSEEHTCSVDERECPNCKRAVERAGKTLQLNHSPFDRVKCTVLQDKMHRERNKIGFK